MINSSYANIFPQNSLSGILLQLDFSTPQMVSVKEGLEIDKKMEELRLDIGDQLFHSISEKDRLFIINTEGVIDLGYEVADKDIKRIINFIDEEFD